jgi:hypothetical protein
VLGRTWEAITPMTTARAWLSLVAAEVDEQRWVLYALGGQGAAQSSLDTLERADVGSTAEPWTTLPSMPSARARCAAVAMENGDSEWTVHVLGGLDADDNIVNTSIIYYVNDANWTEAPGPGSPPRYGLAATTFCWDAMEPSPNSDEYWWCVTQRAFAANGECHGCEHGVPAHHVALVLNACLGKSNCSSCVHRPASHCESLALTSHRFASSLLNHTERTLNRMQVRSDC